MSHTQHIAKRLDWRIVLVIVSLLAILWLQGPRLVDEFQVDEDFRSFYWMNKFRDPALFPNDQLRGYLYTNIRLHGRDVPLYFYSLGYGLLFYAASFFVTPIFFTKILPFFVMPISVWYLFEFGRSVRNRGTGTVLAAGFIFLNLISLTSLSVITGLQRSFACPLMIALVYYLHRQNYVAAAVVVLVSALIYPPVFLLAVVTWGLFVLKPKRHPPVGFSVAKRGFVPLVIAFSLGALALSPILLPRFADVSTSEEEVDVGGQAASAIPESYEHLWDNPQYWAEGRTPLFSAFPFIGRGGLVNKGLDAIHLLILFCISCLIFGVRGRRAFDLPYESWCILWASLIMFVLAWAAIGLTNSTFLYLPSRYTRVGLFLFLSMFVLLNGRDSVEDALVSIQCNRKKLIWLIGGVELLVLSLVLLSPSDRATIHGYSMKWLLAPAGLIFGVLGIVIVRRSSPSAPNTSRFRRTLASRLLIGAAIVVSLSGWGAYASMVSNASFLNPSQAERELLRFLETLPKDVLLAGTPRALDSVPLFAKRQVIFSQELISQDAELMREALNAYYAESAGQVLTFCQQHGVDYLVVNERYFSPDYLANGWFFYSPFNESIAQIVAARSSFVLPQIPDSRKAFQSGPLFVVACTADALQ